MKFNSSKMILLINCGSSWLPDIERNLHELATEYQIYGCDQLLEKPLSLEEIKKFKGIVISGGPMLLSRIEHRDFIKRFEFLKDIEVPVLGICLGHQIIGLVHGSEVKNLGRRITGREDVKIVRRSPLFETLPNGIDFQQDHEECVSLPEDFKLLAKSHSCANEAMEHRMKQIYSVQFHPEASGTQGKILIENFLKLVKES